MNHSNPHRCKVPWSSASLLAIPLAFLLVTRIATLSAAGPPPQVGWQAAAMNPAIESRIDRAVAESLEQKRMSGCVVLLGRRAGIVFEKAYGYRCVEPREEPMTLDTVFDMASLTKPLATATGIMLLVERGQLRLRQKVAEFFPDFAQNGKQEVTIEQLLVHSSGLLPDNPLTDYAEGWQSAGPKIFALTPLSDPGTRFKYSDVNFILLGKIIEQVTGETEAVFLQREVYDKLGMSDSGYLPDEKLRERAETTEKTAGRWLKGEVHDPRAARMGGIAGHAGLFSTAHDLAIYATMMLGQGRYGDTRVLSAAAVAEMTRPRDVDGHRRGLGWDMRSLYSRNRGELMSDRAFGHGGFTGTAMWIDPALDLYVIFLGDRLHPDGEGEVNELAGRIGAMACAAIEPGRPQQAPNRPALAPQRELLRDRRDRVNRWHNGAQRIQGEPSPSPSLRGRGTDAGRVRLGIDVLAADDFQLLRGKRVGLITNQTGLDSQRVSTIERLHQAKDVKLVALFSPEHGIRGALDQANIDDTVDVPTGLPVHSLYGKQNKPTPEQLASLDVLVFDIQDIGTRFYTYPSTMCLALEAAAKAGKQFVVLDRPNPIDGTTVEGPLLDEGRESFVGILRLPIRHGLTVGEIATMFAGQRGLEKSLTVVKMRGWRREMSLFDTGLYWLNPSPNMRSLEAALLYTGVGMLEFTNLSVGRGTESPFEMLGAPWIDENKLADRVNAAGLTGVRVVPVRFTPTATKFKGQECHGIHFIITDWQAFRSFDLGLAIASSLVAIHGQAWQSEPWKKLLGSEEVYRRTLAGEAWQAIRDDVEKKLQPYREMKGKQTLYP
ncbi:MAG: DUF1343 domain-containing protein [Pirellulales bacterium]|nr:DUF1343 domain-containing protein [Pirellulales bacterium]